MPLFLHLLNGMPPLQVVAHRVLWSLLLLALVAAVTGRAGQVLAAARRRAVVPFLSLSAALIAINWSIYVLAVQGHRVVEASLGYFVNPLLSVVFGVVFLKERLRPAQRVSVAMAVAGVAVLALGQGAALAVPLSIAVSFGLYGLVRKVAPVDAFAGLMIETALIAPVALGYLGGRRTRVRAAGARAPDATCCWSRAGR